MTASTSKTIAAKLQIKDGYTVRYIGGDNPATLVGPLPSDARVISDEGQAADAVLVFAADAAELETRLRTELDGLAGARAVWICYPKGNRSDINRDTIWPRLEAVGWKLVSNVAIDDRWSALRIKPASRQ